MVVLSKPLTPLEFNCYDVIHPWHPQCSRVLIDLAFGNFKNSLKIYSSLYLLSSLIQGKLFNPQKWPKIAKDILRSSCFLTWNGSVFISCICLFRWLLKNFYPWTISFVPSFLASITAIQFEREARKKALTVYMLNTMSQIFYSIAKNSNLIHPIPNGEVWLFSFTMSIFLYLYKKQIQSKDLTTMVLRFLVGPGEGGSPSKNYPNDAKKNHENQLNKPSVLNTYKKILDSIQFGPKHKCCVHEKGCVHYCITGFLRPFFVGYIGKVLLKAISSFKLTIKYPQVLVLYLLSSQNVKFGLFLGSFTLFCRSLNCLLRWIRNTDEPINGLLSGFVAGWSMLLFPSPALASYSFWKMIELLCSIGIKNGHIPVIPYSLDILYAALTASMFHVSLFQPDGLSHSYWNFLLNLTNSKYALINRKALCVWGATPTKRFESSLTPDPRYSSEAMKKYLQLQMI